MNLALDKSLPAPGTVIEYHFKAPFVVVSIFVSLLGAITFVELLHRQRKAAGWRYWFQLTLTALPLGLVGIWCMHFVGNAAIILGDGSRDLQPVYSAGFSTLSAIIPVVTIVVALRVSDMRHKGPKTRFASLLAAGIVGGCAIYGMHYTGNIGITNYRTHADPRTIGGAIGIGCVSMTAVVFGVSTLRDSWLNTFRWRFICALIIAVAVPGLHFEASLKITYIFETPNRGSAVAQYLNVIVSSVLTVLTVVACVIIALFTRQEIIEIRSKAEQVVLNCAWFDHQGRVMVTRNGILPCYTVTRNDNERGFDDDFNIRHPAFHWLYKITRNWNSVSRFVSGMKKHLDSLDSGQHLPHSANPKGMHHSQKSADQEYSVIFRKRFCIAAAEIAKTLRVDLSELGALYPGVMSFSTFGRDATQRRPFSWSREQYPAIIDIESIQDSFGRGQGLFLTRRVDKQDVPKFQTMDFRFLALDRVIAPLAAAMQVPQENARAYITSIRDQSEPIAKQPFGVYLGLFALCPEADGKLGPKVVVSKTEMHKLPSVYLWSDEVHARFAGMLSRWDGLSSTQVDCALKEGLACLDDDYASFCKALRRGIQLLRGMLNEDFFAYATLNTRLTQVPATHPSDKKAYNGMITFCIIPNIHKSLKYAGDVKLISYNFFRCLQQAREKPQDPGFVARVHQEFGMLANEDEIASPVESPSSAISRISSFLTPASSTRKLMSPKRWNLTPRRSEISLRSYETASQSTIRRDSFTNTHEAPDEEGKNAYSKGAPFGGVLVTRHVTVDQSPRDSNDNITPVTPTSTFSPKAQRISEFKGVASTQTPETSTFVDELCAITRQRWQKQAR